MAQQATAHGRRMHLGQPTRCNIRASFCHAHASHAGIDCFVHHPEFNETFRYAGPRKARSHAPRSWLAEEPPARPRFRVCRTRERTLSSRKRCWQRKAPAMNSEQVPNMTDSGSCATCAHAGAPVGPLGLNLFLFHGQYVQGRFLRRRQHCRPVSMQGVDCCCCNTLKRAVQAARQGQHWQQAWGACRGSGGSAYVVQDEAHK